MLLLNIISKMLYTCDICGFKTPLKGNLSKHLKTRKHAFNLKEKNGMNQNEPKLAHLVHGQKSKKNEMNQNEPKLALLVHEPNEPKTAHLGKIKKEWTKWTKIGSWKIDKKECQINWNSKATEIIGKINGLTPNPGAYFHFKGERYKILKAKLGNGIGNSGEVISNDLEIACENNESVKITWEIKQTRKIQRHV